MATTEVFSGSLNLQVLLQDAFGGDSGGNFKASLAKILTFAAAGGAAPTLTGFWCSNPLTVASAQSLLFAHATNPTVNFGQTTLYSPGFVPAGSKLKLLIIVNLDAALTITVQQAATFGLPIYKGASQGRDLAPGDMMVFYAQAGTAALTTGSNDALTLTPSAGSPTCFILAGYGA